MPDFLSTGIDTSKDQQPLSNGEKYILATIRNKKLLFLSGAYITLAGLLVKFVFDLWTESDGWMKPVLLINSPLMITTFFFIVLTVFFLKYYFNAVHPFTKDISRKKKDIISFSAEKYKTPYFEEFFLKTPLKKRSLIKVNKEFYDAIQDNSVAHMSVAPFSRFVFSIELGNQKIQFNEKHFIIE
jgi:hypothetical protein